MSNYVQSTNFATKDALPSGDPLKIVKGTEINTEFNNIAVAVATKADLVSPTFTGTPTLPTGTVAVTQSAGNNTTALATTAFVTTATAGFMEEPTANGFVVRTAANTSVSRTLIAGAGVSVTNDSGVSGDPTISNTGVLSVNGATGAIVMANIPNVSTATRPTTAANSSGTPMVNTGTGVFTFTVPAGITRIKTSFVAAGGGSGGVASGNAPGGGGGGGGVVAYIPVTAGLVLTVTLGAGAGTGVNGGDTTITGTGVSLSASGGITGTTNYRGGQGGGGSITTLPAGGVGYVFTGQGGGSGAANISGIPGDPPNGGSSMLGGGSVMAGTAGFGGGASNGGTSGAGFCVIEY